MFIDYEIRSYEMFRRHVSHFVRIGLLENVFCPVKKRSSTTKFSKIETVDCRDSYHVENVFTTRQIEFKISSILTVFTTFFRP